MPEIQTVADGWEAFGAAPDESILARVPGFKLLHGNQKVFAFEQKLDPQVDKYSIAVEGGKGAVLNYTENEPKWETFEFSPFNQKDNTIEEYFTHSDTIYALITTRLGETNLQDIFKFNEENKQFEKLEFEAPEAINEGDSFRTSVIVAENATDESTRIVIVRGRSFHIFSLDMTDSSTIIGTHIGDIEDGDGYPRSSAFAAFRNGNNLYITFSEFHGSGNEWNRENVIKYKLDTNESSVLSVAPDASVDFGGGRPQYSFGPYSSWCSGFLWGFCSGSDRIAMNAEEFNGESWVIVGLENDEARWKKRTEVIEEGLIATDNTKKATIVVTKDKTSVLYHDQTEE